MITEIAVTALNIALQAKTATARYAGRQTQQTIAAPPIRRKLAESQPSAQSRD